VLVNRAAGRCARQRPRSGPRVDGLRLGDAVRRARLPFAYKGVRVLGWGWKARVPRAMFRAVVKLIDE
jgi:hypothetical protein